MSLLSNSPATHFAAAWQGQRSYFAVLTKRSLAAWLAIAGRVLGIVPAVGMLLCTACGYHTGGRADAVPKGIQTIAIPAFRNGTTRYRLTDELPIEISREFTARSRFHVVQDASVADAVLNGSINNVLISPSVYDPGSGKATTLQVNFYLTINLVERATGRVLYARSNLEAKTYYQLAIDPHQFFNEADPAYDRLCRDVARIVVSGVVENF